MSRGTVAITGATGFIGAHVIEAMAARGWRQRILVRRLSPLPRLAADTEIVLGSLEDPAALARLVAGAEAVVHLAGAIKGLRDADFATVNVTGVQRLAEACRGQPQLRTLIHLSALAAREPALSPYAASKRAGEDALRAAAGSLPWLCLRPPAVYGPGDRETLAVFRMAQRGLVAVADGGRGRLSLIHVADLAAAIAELAARPPAPDVYEIDDGRVEGYTLREVAELAGRAVGRLPAMVSVPRPVMGFAATVQQANARLSGRAAILSAGKVREIFHPDWLVRDRRLQALLPLPRWPAAAGFAQTAAWYAERKWL